LRSLAYFFFYSLQEAIHGNDKLFKEYCSVCPEFIYIEVWNLENIRIKHILDLFVRYRVSKETAHLSVKFLESKGFIFKTDFIRLFNDAFPDAKGY